MLVQPLCTCVCYHCSNRQSLSNLHRRKSSTLEDNCPIPHTAKDPEASHTEFLLKGECSVKKCTIGYYFIGKFYSTNLVIQCISLSVHCYRVMQCVPLIKLYMYLAMCYRVAAVSQKMRFLVSGVFWSTIVDHWRVLDWRVCCHLSPQLNVVQPLTSLVVQSSHFVLRM